MNMFLLAEAFEEEYQEDLKKSIKQTSLADSMNWVGDKLKVNTILKYIEPSVLTGINHSGLRCFSPNRPDCQE
jgi:hypothetical protein